MSSKIDPSRLYTALLNTGLQQKDNALYQVIYNLIGDLIGIARQTNTIISGGSSSVTNISQQIIQGLQLEDGIDGDIGIGLIGSQGVQGIQGNPGISGDDGEDGLTVIGPAGLPGPQGSQGISGLLGNPGFDGDDGEIIIIGQLLRQFTKGSIIFAGPSGFLSEDNVDLFWDNVNKRLGIGLSTPLSVIHTQSPESSSTYLVDSFSLGAVAPSNNLLARSSRGTNGSPLAVQSGDALFFFQARGSLSTGFLGTEAAGLVFQATENWTLTNQGAQISFHTTPSGSTVAIPGFIIGGNGKVVAYNNIISVGLGVPAIYGTGRSTSQTAAVASVAAYTVGASDGSFIISANINITTSTAFSFTCTCTYTDEGGTVRTLTLNFSQVSGTFVQTITNVLGTGAYEGVPVHIRCKASTSITIATTGTFTTVTYNVEGYITQIG